MRPQDPVDICHPKVSVLPKHQEAHGWSHLPQTPYDQEETEAQVHLVSISHLALAGRLSPQILATDGRISSRGGNHPGSRRAGQSRHGSRGEGPVCQACPCCPCHHSSPAPLGTGCALARARGRCCSARAVCLTAGPGDGWVAHGHRLEGQKKPSQQVSVTISISLQGALVHIVLESKWDAFHIKQCF